MENEENILISSTSKEGVLRLIMNDQNSKNSLSEEMMNKLCGSDNCNEKKEGSTLLEIADNKNTLEDMKADLQQRLI